MAWAPNAFAATVPKASAAESERVGEANNTGSLMSNRIGTECHHPGISSMLCVAITAHSSEVFAEFCQPLTQRLSHPTLQSPIPISKPLMYGPTTRSHYSKKR